MEHNESAMGVEIGSQDLLPATPKSGDQHLLVEKTRPAELGVRPKKIKDGLVYPDHDEAVQTELIGRPNCQNRTSAL